MDLGPCPSQVFGPKRQRHDEGGSSSCSHSASCSQMQQEIVDLRARLERETESRLQFQNAGSLFLQNIPAPLMTPELAAILNPMAAHANDGDVGPNNASSCADHDAFSHFE